MSDQTYDPCPAPEQNDGMWSISSISLSTVNDDASFPHYRVGRRNPQNVYRHDGPDDEDGTFIGVFFTPDRGGMSGEWGAHYARLAVAALNTIFKPPPSPPDTLTIGTDGGEAVIRCECTDVPIIYMNNVDIDECWRRAAAHVCENGETSDLPQDQVHRRGGT